MRVSVVAMWKVLIVVCCGLWAMALQADDFSDCVADLQRQARDAGVADSLVSDVLGTVQYLPRIIELDRGQPEFTRSFADYFNRRVTEKRVTQGRELLQTHRVMLSRLTRVYGVPPQYLLAFWGLETNFGGYMGKVPILDSLATLACDPRRSKFFTVELFEALRLLQLPGVEAPMTGSWAGAVGHTQFMPSNYRRYAIDGDRDGQTDLWGSIPDALSSGANFLEQLGWERGVRWGREVRLPKEFDYSTLGLKNKRPLAQWGEQGVRTATGANLPKVEIDAALLVPAGHRGPAFLVYDNFGVIMRWNRSEFYALAVGHLADRINGAGTLRRPPPTDQPPLARAIIVTLQERLNASGFDSGKPDGVMGPGTRRAIGDFQKARKLLADGYPRQQVFEALDIPLDSSKE